MAARSSELLVSKYPDEADRILRWLRQGSGLWRLENMPRDMRNWHESDYHTVNAACIWVTGHWDDKDTIDAQSVAGSALHLRSLFWSNYGSVPLAVRLCIAHASTLNIFGHIQSDEVCVQLFKFLATPDEEVDSKLVQEAAESHIAMFPGPVFCWSYRYPSPPKFAPSCWETFLRNTVTLPSLTVFSNHWDIHPRKTPLHALVKGVAYRCIDMGVKHISKILSRIHRVLLRWVFLLAESGIDLIAYGKWEAKQFSEFFILR